MILANTKSKTLHKYSIPKTINIRNRNLIFFTPKLVNKINNNINNNPDLLPQTAIPIKAIKLSYIYDLFLLFFIVVQIASIRKIAVLCNE